MTTRKGLTVTITAMTSVSPSPPSSGSKNPKEDPTLLKLSTTTSSGGTPPPPSAATAGNNSVNRMEDESKDPAGDENPVLITTKEEFPNPVPCIVNNEDTSVTAGESKEDEDEALQSEEEGMHDNKNNYNNSSNKKDSLASPNTGNKNNNQNEKETLVSPSSKNTASPSNTGVPTTMAASVTPTSVNNKSPAANVGGTISELDEIKTPPEKTTTSGTAAATTATATTIKTVTKTPDSANSGGGGDDDSSNDDSSYFADPSNLPSPKSGGRRYSYSSHHSASQQQQQQHHPPALFSSSRAEGAARESDASLSLSDSDDDFDTDDNNNNHNNGRQHHPRQHLHISSDAGMYPASRGTPDVYPARIMRVHSVGSLMSTSSQNSSEDPMIHEELNQVAIPHLHSFVPGEIASGRLSPLQAMNHHFGTPSPQQLAQASPPTIMSYQSQQSPYANNLPFFNNNNNSNNYARPTAHANTTSSEDWIAAMAQQQHYGAGGMVVGTTHTTGSGWSEGTLNYSDDGGDAHAFSQNPPKAARNQQQYSNGSGKGGNSRQKSKSRAVSSSRSKDRGTGSNDDDSDDEDETYRVYWQRWIMLLYMSVLNLLVRLCEASLLYRGFFLSFLMFLRVMISSLIGHVIQLLRLPCSRNKHLEISIQKNWLLFSWVLMPFPLLANQLFCLGWVCAALCCLELSY